MSAETRVDKDLFFVRSLHRFSDPRDLIAIGLSGHGKVSSVVFRPEVFTLKWSDATMEAVFSGRDSLRLRARGAAGDLAVAPPDARVEADGERTVVVRHPAGSPVLKITPVSGTLDIHDRRITFGAEAGGGELRIEEIGGEPDPGGAFDTHVESRASEFQDWLKRFQRLYPDAHPGALTEAAYLFWACQAGPRGALRRPAVYMSKNWMTGIWSWDNCFNAVALADIDPTLAWDQFCFFFDWQTEDGRVPDLITTAGADWGMTKPPIYGWTLSKLRRRHEFFNDSKRLREVYGPMARQVRFWLETRDGDGDGLPEYHHGCDSGWDNGTAFINTTPCASPDLAAWLILQLEELARVAPIVGCPADTPRWLAEADRLAAAICRHCWDGARWQVVQANTHCPPAQGDCLLPWLGGMAGHRFTKEQKSAVIQALGAEGRFLTPHGLATESIASPLYERDGYWRGPVWGSSTVMAVEACRACGSPELATEIARRFLGMAPDFGFAENHDALTGRGLRDPGYTWTAAAWLILQQKISHHSI